MVVMVEERRRPSFQLPVAGSSTLFGPCRAGRSPSLRIENKPVECTAPLATPCSKTTRPSVLRQDTSAATWPNPLPVARHFRRNPAGAPFYRAKL